MDLQARGRGRWKRWNRKTTKKVERGMQRKRQISLQRMLQLPEGAKIPFKKAVGRYKALRRKVDRIQKMNRKRPRGPKRELPKKDARLYRKLVMWITTNTKRGQRQKYFKRASLVKIAGPEEQLVRGLIRIAYRNPAHRDNILELILDPEAGWDFQWTAQHTSSTD